jgi:hypothetical protein
MSSIIGNAITYQVFLSRLNREIRRANKEADKEANKEANKEVKKEAKKEDTKVEITENKITSPATPSHPLHLLREEGQGGRENKITYDRFIEDIGFTAHNFVKLGDFFLQLLCQYPHNIFERVYSKSYYFSREQAKLIINPKYLKEIKDNVIIHPSSLPMLCPPVE